ncbi:hypothetical protein OAY16_04925, partial [Candidatus Pelagibacter sp.]|nr:hypothetical protein [Candidatus Pelagibacter sp.]
LLSHENLISKELIKKYNLEKYSIIKWSTRMKKMKTNKNFVINFSGGVSSYRIGILKKIRYNKKIFKNLINTNLINKSFVKSKIDKNSLVFSLHPKKTNNWKHSSPTRYLNSINKGEIPIIMDKFNDKYINLALTDDLLLFKSKKKIVDRIKKYRKKINKLDLYLKKQTLREF